MNKDELNDVLESQLDYKLSDSGFQQASWILSSVSAADIVEAITVVMDQMERGKLTERSDRHRYLLGILKNMRDTGGESAFED